MTGSVKQYKTKGGVRWRVTFDGPPHPDGTRRQITRGGFKTMREAEAALDVLRQRYRGVTDPSADSLGTYLDAWVAHRAAVGSIRPATASQYTSALKMLGDELAAVPMMKVTAAHLDRRYAELSTTGGRNGAGRSASTVRKLHAVIRKGLADAVRKGMIPSNAADAADPPSSSAARPTERQVWTKAEGFAFLRWDGLVHEHEALAWLAMFGGLRRAELAGLRWSDLHGDELHVTRAISEDTHGRLVVGEPKTARGRRIVTIGPEAVDVLDRYRRHQRELYMATGHRPDDDAMLVSSSTVAAMTPEMLTATWKRLVDRAARDGVVPYRMTLHDARHWCGTHLAAAGVDLRTVADILGHADPAFTLRVYAHSDGERRRAAAEALSQVL